MKMFGKKIIAGTIAASFLIGGAAVVHNQAFADTTSTSSASASTSVSDQTYKADKAQRPDGRMGFRGGINFMQEAATILGIDEATLKASLKDGKTLVQLAQEKGITEDDLVQKLAAAETKAIDTAVSEGKLTQEQADKMKTGLADRLKQMVENKRAEGMGGPGGPKGHGPGGFFGKPGALEEILGVTQDELKTGLAAGKSIAEIAQEKGISKEELISKLKDSMTEQITQFVDRKGQPGDGKSRGAKQQDKTTTTTQQ
ncbi:hypothetical protein [Paenibacillus hamazuiensis]|uniref:hypothetical protein n=1 Tax=Paenibacillus hamazuiensis TaxID=2936508 RepID=UPI00200F2EE0|nr:hypothetical protein [Paenibacillus hamazuiensis]